MSFNQTDRLIRMTKGPLGPDQVAMTSFSGQEEISRLFNFKLEFISTELDLKPGKIVGKDVNIEIDRRDKDGNKLPPRFFHGFINRFAAGPVAKEETGKFKYRHYRAEMVPWLWFLTQTSRCFLFFPEKEDKTIFEVVQAVFDRAKADLHVDPVNDLKGIGDLKKRKVKHCVQYRETDFNFVSRTLERYGAFYYFKFEDGKHTLVVDMKKNYPKCEEAEVSYPGMTGSHTPVDHITDWQHDYEFVSGKWTHTDYNFEKPSTSLKADAPKLPSIDLAQNDKYEIYDYPGEYAEKSDGKSDAKIRQEEAEVQHNIVNGSSLCRTFTPGFKFKLADHPDEDAVSEHKNSYLLLSVDHSATQPGADTGDDGGSEYANRFSCIPDSVQFRPARLTPKPVISGTQTAVVVGPSGETIHTDKFGRVKVQFHWDREGKKDGNSSCWVRISYPWAGQGWGGMSIPHVGQEVIVSFLEGDPDQPLITGRVYNAEQMPPLNLPAEKDWTINRDHYGNEINMKGDEGTISLICPTHTSEIHLGKSINLWTISDHIQKNKGDTRIETLGNWTQDIVGDTKINVGLNVTEAFVGWNHKWIGGFTTTFIGGYKGEMIVGKESKVIAGAKHEVIKGSVVKIHKGTEYKHAQNGDNEKAPSLKQMVKDVKHYRDAEKTVIKGDRNIKAKGNLISKGEKILAEGKAMEHSGADALQKFGGKMVGKFGKYLVKTGGKQQMKAVDMQWDAIDVKIKASASVKIG